MPDARLKNAAEEELDQRLDQMEEDLIEGLNKHFIELGELEEGEASDHAPGHHNEKPSAMAGRVRPSGERAAGEAPRGVQRHSEGDEG